MSSWDKKLSSVTIVERRFASHPNSTNAIVGCCFGFYNLSYISFLLS